MKLAIFLLLVVLVLSSVLVVFNYWTPQNQLVQPSPSDFTPSEWMQFIPSNIEGFRFLDMKSLAPITGLFQSDVLFNLTAIGMNITIYDVRYGLAIQDSNGNIIDIMTVNQTFADSISTSLINSSLVRHEYHNNTFYAIWPDEETGTEGYWVCVDRGAIVTCTGGDPAFAALKTVVDSTTTTFFNRDTLKVAYLMTSKGKENFIFTYYTAGGNNTYNVDWLMGGASNSTQLDVRVCYHFQTTDDLNRSYQNFTSAILSDARAVYASVNFIIGDYTYSHSNVREVLMSF